MKTGWVGIIVVLAVSVGAPWLIRQRAAVQFQATRQSLAQQASQVVKLAEEDQLLSSTVAALTVSPTLVDKQLAELMKLRNEVTQLHRVAAEMDQIRRRISRLRESLDAAAAEQEAGPQIDTALLPEEMPLRQARAARLQRWLEQMPGEKIPEMQLLDQNRWITRVDRPLITDDDYRSASAGLRADAEGQFVPMVFKALKQYAQANNGQFPGDLSELKPYFIGPVDDAILQRWEVVPASDLPESLAETGGDLLITEKAPVDKQRDPRNAIGLTSYRGTVAAGRWDGLP